MILRELFKNALIDPFILKGWINRLMFFHLKLRLIISIIIIILLILYYIYLFIWPKKISHTEGLKNGFMFINNINQNISKFKAFIKAIKHMLLGVIIMLCSWLIISTIFYVAQNKYNNDYDKNYVSGNYSILNQENIDKGIMLKGSEITPHLDYLSIILGQIAIYLLLLLMLGAFFYTFSLGNKFIRNIAILIWVLAILLFFSAKLLDYYNM